MLFSPWVLEGGWDLYMQRGAVSGLGPNSPPCRAIQHASLALNCFFLLSLAFLSLWLEFVNHIIP